MLDMGCRFSKLNLSDRPMLCWGMLGVHTQSWLYLLFSCCSPVPPCHKVLPKDIAIVRSSMKIYLFSSPSNPTGLNPKIREGPLEPRDVRYQQIPLQYPYGLQFPLFPGFSRFQSTQSTHRQHQGDEDAAVRMEADKADWVAGMGQPKTGLCFQHGALVHPQNWSF